MNNMKAFIRICLSSTAMIGSLAGGTAFAQSGDDQPARAEQAKSSSEIVVTARRREERLLDVPLSISAIGGDELQTRGLTDSEDYLRGVPGVNQQAGYDGQSIIIRGIETSAAAQNFALGATYASYFGETPTTTSGGLASGSSIDIKAIDINRVEVLRGPQGTSFGDASLGGAVRVIPNAPKLGRTEVNAAIEYSHTGKNGSSNYNGNAAVNLPFGDRVAIRAVAYGSSDSGYVVNRSKSNPLSQNYISTFGLDITQDKGDIGQYKVWGGRLAVLAEPVDDLRFTLNMLSQKTELDGTPFVNSGIYEQIAATVHPDFVRRGQQWGYYDSKISIINPVLNYSTDWADIVATYSHVRGEVHQATPFAAVGLALPFTSVEGGVHNEDVGELRLTTKFDGPINAVIGGFLQDAKDTGEFDYVSVANQNTLPFGTKAFVMMDRHLKQQAAYGEVFWEIVPRLTLTVGARYFNYSRRIVDERDGLFLGLLSPTIFTGKFKEHGVSPHFNLSFKPDENSMLYANYSQGFRLGTPKQPLTSACDLDNDGLVDGTNFPLAESGSVRTDKTKNYEVGGKGTFLNGAVSVDAAVFHMDWPGVPVTVAPQFCNQTFTTNAGRAAVDGVELALNFRLSPSLKVNFAGSYTHARITKDIPSLSAEDGARLPGSPKYNGNMGIEYDYSLAGHPAFIRADAIYIGSTYGELTLNPAIRTDSYVKVDLLAGVTFGDLDVSAFARNLFDEDEFTSRGVRAFSSSYPQSANYFGFRQRPRTIGIRLAYHFGK